MKTMTAADEYALVFTSPEWFSPFDMPFRRPLFRCERLYKAGALDRRLNPKHDVHQYRRLGGATSGLAVEAQENRLLSNSSQRA